MNSLLMGGVVEGEGVEVIGLGSRVKIRVGMYLITDAWGSMWPVGGELITLGGSKLGKDTFSFPKNSV